MSFFDSPEQRIEYKEWFIHLEYCAKKDSPLSMPPHVWYWCTSFGGGYARTKEEAIEQGKDSITNNVGVLNY